MENGLEAIRRFNELMGPVMLWAVNHWQVVLGGIVVLGVSLGLAQRAQQIHDRDAIVRAIRKQ